MLDAGERDELARTLHAPESDRGLLDRRCRVGGAADREIGQRDAVQAVLVAAERGEDRITEPGHVADRRLQPPVVLDRRPRETHRGREAGAGHQQDRLAAEARAESSDRDRIEMLAPLGPREQDVERGRERQRAQRLHREEIAQVKDQVRKVLEALELKRPEPSVAMKRGGDHVAEARQQRDGVDVVVRGRAAEIPVREQQHRKPGRRVRPQRRLGPALHLRHRLAVRQRVIAPRVRRRCRIADDDHVRQRVASERAVDVAVRRRRDIRDERVGDVGQEVRDVARRAVAARHTLPVRLHVLAGREPAEILRHVAARHGIGSGKRARRNDLGRLCRHRHRVAGVQHDANQRIAHVRLRGGRTIHRWTLSRED